MKQIDNLYKKPVFKNVDNDSYKAQPLPAPRGNYPFRLALEQILGKVPSHKMIFHITGDTGNTKYPNNQQKIAREMSGQFGHSQNPEDDPLFFFHLGDVVYNYGEEDQYYKQFFEPYRNYPAPIFAIAGNHDADVRPELDSPPESLHAFRKVFCDTREKALDIAGDTGRKSMIQPYIFWTLNTPLATFINLYSNVPKFGAFTDEQKQWFIEELKEAGKNPRNKILIVCVHHSPYSADSNHGSSLPVQLFLNDAFEQAALIPDIVFSGHVHNYQRFIKQFPAGKVVPFIVAGAGGYADLHTIAQISDPQFSSESPLLEHVQLENFCDKHHGFLKVVIEKQNDKIRLSGEYYVVPESEDPELSLFDRFEIQIPGEEIKLH